LEDISLLILSAGSSSRFNHQNNYYKVKKQWLRVEDKPLWLFVVDRFREIYNFADIIVTSDKNELNYMKKFDDDIKFIIGGETRQESIINGIRHIDTKYVMVTDVARACVPSNVIIDMIKHKDNADIIVPYINISDTVVYENDVINRDNVKVIQTPQLSDVNILKKALDTDTVYTDDSSAIKAIGGKVYHIKGDKLSAKLTYRSDIDDLKCLKPPLNYTFSGIGLDIHKFQENKKMYLGGVLIAVDYGFEAHSDGDVLIHSLIDALLGAIGGGDIGEFFPDTDEKYRDIDSKILLKEIVKFVYKVGYDIINIDITIVAQKPRIGIYKAKIQKTIADILQIPQRFVNIKATTAEKLGFVGKKEGVVVQSIANVRFNNWIQE